MCTMHDDVEVESYMHRPDKYYTSTVLFIYFIVVFRNDFRVSLAEVNEHN